MPSPTRTICWASLVLVLTGCGPQEYPIRGMPFCSVDTPWPGEESWLTSPTFLLGRAGDQRNVEELVQEVGEPSMPRAFTRDRVLAAVIQCPERPQQIRDEWAEELTEESVPYICPGQRLIYRGTLKAESGILRLPKLDLECTNGGTLVQEDDHTLAQKLRRFMESVNRFALRHDRLPQTWDELARNGNADPLPVDPWGTPLRFSASASQIVLDSAGPDQAFDTDDDIVVVEQRRQSSTNIVSFPGVGHHPAADYDAFSTSRTR